MEQERSKTRSKLYAIYYDKKHGNFPGKPLFSSYKTKLEQQENGEK